VVTECQLNLRFQLPRKRRRKKHSLGYTKKRSNPVVQCICPC